MAESITNVLGTVAIKHCGEYDATMHYEKLNVVTYQGSSYCAKGPTQGNLPTNTTYWDLMAEKGDKGDTGATGQDGHTPVKGIDYYTASDKAELEATLSSDVSDEVSDQLSTLTSATPLAASSTSGMTDTTRIYVNTTDGHWYWYNGSTWTDGGLYQATEDSDTLKRVDIASDYLSNKANLLNYTLFTIDDFAQASNVTKTDVTKYINNNGKIDTTSKSNRTAVKFPVPLMAKEIIVQGTYIGTEEQYSIFFCDNNENIIKTIDDATPVTIGTLNNCVHIENIPAGTTYIYYTCYTTAYDIVQLIKKYTDELNKEVMPSIFKDYLMNFEDKSSNITWTTGYAVPKGKSGQIVEKSDTYAVANITVSKGDIIIINRHTGLSKDYASFSRKIYDGKDTTYRTLENITDSKDDFVKNAVYCFGEDMDVTLTTVNYATTVVKWFNVEAYNNSFERAARFFNRFPFEETMKKLTPLYMRPRNISTLYQNPLVLLHASDVHNNVQSIVNIKEFMNIYGKYINDVLITGDLCSEFLEYRPIYAQEGYEKMLLTTGNHDVYNVDGEAPTQGDVNHWASNIQKYNQYFKPSIDNWNVTQPDDAETNGYCYYYKDYSVIDGVSHYTVSTVRLICLDAMAYDEVQHNWLRNVLTDALTNNITVLIAEHFPPTASPNDDFNLFDTGFSSLIRGLEADYAHFRLGYYDEFLVNHNAPDLVDEFINNGGEFACWLCGHLHYAQAGTIKSHPNQIYIAIEQCSIYGSWNDTPAEINNPTEDLFNIVSIDTYNKVIRVARIGAEYDIYMRHKESMAIDYKNHKLISTF